MEIVVALSPFYHVDTLRCTNTPTRVSGMDKINRLTYCYCRNNNPYDRLKMTLGLGVQHWGAPWPPGA